MIQDSGDSAGAVGELPSNGLSNALTTCDIAVVTVSGGADGCCLGAATVTSAVAVAEVTSDDATVTVASGTVGPSAVLVGAVVSGCTVLVPVEAVFGTESCVVLVDCWEMLDVLDFFFFFSVRSVVDVLVSLESVVALAVLLELDDDVDPEVPDVSADATPCPVKTAAPIPRAAANPLIRPTYTPAPMTMCIPSRRAPVCGFDESVGIASRG
jgi:hypothetical protein